MNDPGFDKQLQESAVPAERFLRKRIPREDSAGHSGGSPSATSRDILRKSNDDTPSGNYFQPKRWWFTSTAFPLIAGTFGPLATLMSVCALVQSWIVTVPGGGSLETEQRVPDPKWLTAINAVSLLFAIAANLLLLLNFAHRVRYAIAQPLTIIFWYISSILLLALVIAASKHLRVKSKNHEYSQSYFYGVISSVLYFTVSTMLVWNSIGAYKFKAYPPSFTTLTIPQRTLMLQTISYVFYLSIGASMFSSLEGWSYVDGVYFSDYTLLTIGLGSDFPLKRTVSRALLIPYAAGGILILGLVIGSVRGLFLERGKSEFHGRTIHKERNKILKGLDSSKVNSQKEFELMREFQRKADKIGRYWGLGLSFSAFLFLWLVGAMVFMYCEKWTYFDALYFAFTSLLTIGYGDFIPGKHSFSKPFFVIWSLVAVPSVTILISNMGDTVVGWFNKGTLWLGQRTILPERQVIPESLNEKSPESNNQLGERNLEVLDGDDGPTGQIGRQEQVRIQMSKILVKEIAKLAKDINTKPPKLYGWKEWERFLELLGEGGDEISEDWRWLEDAELFGNDNTETEWVMQKMCARLEFILTEDLVDENK